VFLSVTVVKYPLHRAGWADALALVLTGHEILVQQSGVAHVLNHDSFGGTTHYMTRRSVELLREHIVNTRFADDLRFASFLEATQ